MTLRVQNYIRQVIEKYGSGQAREHAYRSALEKLFEEVTELNVVNDPKRSEYGAPDFVFLKKKTTVAYAEAKDIDVYLSEIEKGEQMIRYYGYSNLILTNYLEFRFYRNGQKYCEPIKIGELNNGKIDYIEDNYILLEDTIRDFIKESKEPIKSGIILAKVMAGKARRIRDNINAFLSSGDDEKNENLLSIYNIIKKLLLEDLNYEKFADMYAQTLVYGLFVARYHDKSAEDFSRREARDLIPASNQFLRHFFDHITGLSFDGRIEIIVNELCEEFTNADVNAIVHDYYKVEKNDSRDPIVHFYEDFLKEYNPKERMDLGVFYTPLPVVRFIVHSIDEILNKEFKLNGLSDSSKTDMPLEIQGKKIKQSIHRVQVLDPATGTGTFLNEIILQIKKSFEGQEGRWPKYLQEDLLPRLHGFEIMMASYTIAHLKISSTIKESGAEFGEKRLGIYLTNSLEKIEEKQKTLFDSIGLAKAITEESHEANNVKNKLPIMVVLGNPPYSGESMNPSYTDNDVYKFEPGTKHKLQERNSKWINDDYVKFIRLAESLIEKTGEGIVGMITAHGYLDNPTFRGMRYHLMQTFDMIYVFDLHGNANKKETAENGEQDKNVFDIKTGVAIILAIKKKTKSKKLAEVFRFDLFGSRERKFEFLNQNSLKKVKWNKVSTSGPNYEFVIRDEKIREEYNKGFSINDLFVKKSVGVVTAKDDVFIGNDSKSLEKQVKEYFINNKIDKLFDDSKIRNISYRPFDDKLIYYDVNLIERPREEIMNNFNMDNSGLVSVRQAKAGGTYQHILVAKNMVESTYVSNKTSEIGYVFPLYFYTNDGLRAANFKKEIIVNIEKIVGKIKSEDVLNYIYAILYSLSYREKYKEFLKIDFPKIPYPKNDKQFFSLVKMGEELTKLHLLESLEPSKFITKYPIPGDDKIEKIEYKNDKVFINRNQYFEGVSQYIWDFYVGGYQPAQKWLKDRKGSVLSSEELSHYQKIIVSLVKTKELMGKIDKLL